MDAVTKALIETIGGAGYAVVVGGANWYPCVEAIDGRTGERFIVRGADVHSAAVELAEQIGIDLED